MLSVILNQKDQSSIYAPEYKTGCFYKAPDDSTHVQVESNLMRHRDEGQRSGQDIISWVLKIQI